MSGGDEIKSALDIAMEKAAKLGSLSDEEKQRLNEEKLAAAGEALARRCLDGTPLRDVELELAGRSGEDRAAITGYLLADLAKGIDITQRERSDRALAAIEQFSNDAESVRHVKDLFDEYEGVLRRVHDENAGALEAAKMEQLNSLGISGSAIVPAARSSPEWLDLQERIALDYRRRLDELKARWSGS